MSFIPYTDDTFHLPYCSIDEVKSDLFNVSATESDGKTFIYGSIALGNVEYDMFAEGEGELAALSEFNMVVETFLPAFKRKYSHET